MPNLIKTTQADEICCCGWAHLFWKKQKQTNKQTNKVHRFAFGLLPILERLINDIFVMCQWCFASISPIMALFTMPWNLRYMNLLRWLETWMFQKQLVANPRPDSFLSSQYPIWKQKTTILETNIHHQLSLLMITWPLGLRSKAADSQV